MLSYICVGNHKCEGGCIISNSVKEPFYCTNMADATDRAEYADWVDTSKVDYIERCYPELLYLLDKIL